MLSIQSSLWNLAFTLFNKLGCSVEDCRHYSVEHPDDKRVSLIITPEYTNGSNDSLGVIILDWKRVVGITQILKAHQVLERGNWDFSKLIIISKKGYSKQSENLANKLDIILLTEGHLKSVLMQEQSIPLKSSKDIANELMGII